MSTTNTATHFVTIGDNGVSLVVWGVGDTREAAEADAAESLAETTGSRPELVTVPCAADVAEEVRGGEVALEGGSLVVEWRGGSSNDRRGRFDLERAERVSLASKPETEEAHEITIDPSNPFAGIVADEDLADVFESAEKRGARAVAMELLSETAGATGWVWTEGSLDALTKAIDDANEAEHRRGEIPKIVLASDADGIIQAADMARLFPRLPTAHTATTLRHAMKIIGATAEDYEDVARETDSADVREFCRDEARALRAHGR